MNHADTEISTDFPVVEVCVEAPPDRRDRVLEEPVTCGLPWPRGVLQDAALLALEDEGRTIALQTRVLDRWPDGSIRWVLLDWQAAVQGTAAYRVRVMGQTQPVEVRAKHVVVIGPGEGTVEVNTGAARFSLCAKSHFPFAELAVGGVVAIDPAGTCFQAEDEVGRVYMPFIQRLSVEEPGPVRAAVRAEGQLVREGVEPLTDFVAYLHFFAGSATVRFSITLCNPRKAGHPGGQWDLGAVGSVYLRDATLTLALPAGEAPATLRCSPAANSPFERFDLPFELYQDSSGGQNWKSSNHMNRHRVVPNTFCGYRLRAGCQERLGQRATPVVSLERGGRSVAVAMEHFWQNFPKAIEATEEKLLVRLFPHQYADVHEIQGGEQKTHTFFVAFARDTATEEPLAWCRAPAVARAAPSWYCSTGALPYLVPRAQDVNTAYLRLIDAVIEGEDTFEHKREVIDEYGWRHFGEVYADHEAVFHEGPTPLVSHYNNQYDTLAGMTYHFLRSGDRRWWGLIRDLAAHVIDIDLYHTEQDKWAYNHGLFWHTYHYVDADTGTHRAYPQASKTCGGGPSGGHNYTTGLMLYHFLTGDPLARQAVVDLARWVLDMDDGRKTIYRWLAGGYTAHSSASGDPGYHGPERPGANSILALIDGHLLTHQSELLAKAEQLICRCIHPADDLEARELSDPERRWFYAMFLKALGRYLDYKAEIGCLDYMYSYARASLLHYARWMAAHERPNLESREKLHYPTETWVAQDMRKSDVLYYAAMYAAGEERSRFLERAEFFFRYASTTLLGMKTRTFTRPVAILLSHGLMHSHFQQNPAATALALTEAVPDFGRPERFIPQKVRALRRAVALVIAFGVAAMLALVYWLR